MVGHFYSLTIVGPHGSLWFPSLPLPVPNSNHGIGGLANHESIGGSDAVSTGSIRGDWACGRCSMPNEGVEDVKVSELPPPSWRVPDKSPPEGSPISFTPSMPHTSTSFPTPHPSASSIGMPASELEGEEAGFMPGEGKEEEWGLWLLREDLLLLRREPRCRHVFVPLTGRRGQDVLGKDVSVPNRASSPLSRASPSMGIASRTSGEPQATATSVTANTIPVAGTNAAARTKEDGQLSGPRRTPVRRTRANCVSDGQEPASQGRAELEGGLQGEAPEGSAAAISPRFPIMPVPIADIGAGGAKAEEEMGGPRAVDIQEGSQAIGAAEARLPSTADKGSLLGGKEGSGSLSSTKKGAPEAEAEKGKPSHRGDGASPGPQNHGDSRFTRKRGDPSSPSFPSSSLPSSVAPSVPASTPPATSPSGPTSDGNAEKGRKAVPGPKPRDRATTLARPYGGSTRGGGLSKKKRRGSSGSPPSPLPPESRPWELQEPPGRRWGGLSAPPNGASFRTAAAYPSPLALPLPPSLPLAPPCRSAQEIVRRRVWVHGFLFEDLEKEALTASLPAVARLAVAPTAPSGNPAGSVLVGNLDGKMPSTATHSRPRFDKKVATRTTEATSTSLSTEVMAVTFPQAEAAAPPTASDMEIVRASETGSQPSPGAATTAGTPIGDTISVTTVRAQSTDPGVDSDAIMSGQNVLGPPPRMATDLVRRNPTGAHGPLPLARTQGRAPDLDVESHGRDGVADSGEEGREGGEEGGREGGRKEGEEDKAGKEDFFVWFLDSPMALDASQPVLHPLLPSRTGGRDRGSARVASSSSDPALLSFLKRTEAALGPPCEGPSQAVTEVQAAWRAQTAQAQERGSEERKGGRQGNGEVQKGRVAEVIVERGGKDGRGGDKGLSRVIAMDKEAYMDYVQGKGGRKRGRGEGGKAQRGRGGYGGGERAPGEAVDRERERRKKQQNQPLKIEPSSLPHAQTRPGVARTSPGVGRFPMSATPAAAATSPASSFASSPRAPTPPSPGPWDGRQGGKGREGGGRGMLAPSRPSTPPALLPPSLGSLPRALPPSSGYYDGNHAKMEGRKGTANSIDPVLARWSGVPMRSSTWGLLQQAGQVVARCQRGKPEGGRKRERESEGGRGVRSRGEGHKEEEAGNIKPLKSQTLRTQGLAEAARTQDDGRRPRQEHPPDLNATKKARKRTAILARQFEEARAERMAEVERLHAYYRGRTFHVPAGREGGREGGEYEVLMVYSDVALADGPHALVKHKASGNVCCRPPVSVHRYLAHFFPRPPLPLRPSPPARSPALVAPHPPRLPRTVATKPTKNRTTAVVSVDHPNQPRPFSFPPLNAGDLLLPERPLATSKVRKPSVTQADYALPPRPGGSRVGYAGDTSKDATAVAWPASGAAQKGKGAPASVPERREAEHAFINPSLSSSRMAPALQPRRTSAHTALPSAAVLEPISQSFLRKLLGPDPPLSPPARSPALTPPLPPSLPPPLPPSPSPSPSTPLGPLYQTVSSFLSAPSPQPTPLVLDPCGNPDIGENCRDRNERCPRGRDDNCVSSSPLGEKVEDVAVDEGMGRGGGGSLGDRQREKRVVL